jgi:hypothetical protein
VCQDGPADGSESTRSCRHLHIEVSSHSKLFDAVGKRR